MAQDLSLEQLKLAAQRMRERAQDPTTSPKEREEIRAYFRTLRPPHEEPQSADDSANLSEP